MSSSQAQNPYDSYIVEASAGSGKTYQLSRRFLHLIASGAAPTQILALTFTVKAAKEMRARIIEEACALLIDEKKQLELSLSMQNFYEAAKNRHQGVNLRSPIPPKEVAKAILSSTQSLKVTTIDATFSEWVRKFPWEASGNEPHEQLPPFFNVLGSSEIEEIDADAWELMFAGPELRELVLEIWQKLSRIEVGRGILGIEDRVLELFKYATFLWTASFAQGNSALLYHSEGSKNFENREQMLAHIKDLLLEIVSQSPREEQFVSAIARGDFNALCDLRLFTKAGEISGATIKGKRRELLTRQIALVDDICKTYLDQEKIQNLNQLGALFYQVYQSWQKERDLLKFAKNALEFQDLAKGSFRLFEGEKGTGAVWLLQKGIQHLLIDEFQDTSFLQWSVFAKLASEMLAGRGVNDASTVFIVGDPKQSIYGFREADPQVLQLAKEAFTSFEKKTLPLTVSYRQAPLLLEFINQVFPPLFGESFAPHLPATRNLKQEEELLVPGCSKITLLPLAKRSGDAEESAVENEARALAAYLQAALSGKTSHPVYYKTNAGPSYRNLQARDCCILYRSAVHVDIYERELHKVGIATRKEEQRGFFSRPEICDALAMLRFLAHPNDVVALLSFLASPFMALADSEVLGALSKLSEEETSHTPTNILALLPETVQEVISKLQIQAVSILPHELLWQAIVKLEARQGYDAAFGEREGLLAHKNLLRLVEICAALEDQGYASLSKIGDRFAVLQATDEHGSAVMDSNVVTLMTIHKAKGLEYPLVAAVGTANAWYKQDRYWLKSTEPQGVYFMGVSEQQPLHAREFLNLVAKGQRAMQEESKRLLYVALSRASQYLLISGHEGHEKKAEAFYPALWEAARSFSSCREREDGGLEIVNRWTEAAIENEEASNQEILNIEFLRKRAAAPMLSQCDIVKPHTEIVLSRHEDMEPELASISSQLGTFIHRILELHSLKKDLIDAPMLFAKMVRSKGESQIHKNQGWWKEIFSQAMHQVESTLNHPLWKRWHDEALEVQAEAGILHYEFGRLVRGQVDLLLRFADEIVVVDYKSGAKKVLDEDEAALQEYCFATGYFRQLGYYQRALKKLHPGKVIRAFVWFTAGPIVVEIPALGERNNKVIPGSSNMIEQPWLQ